MTLTDKASPPIVPEFEVADLSRSLYFYVDILGFSIKVERPEELFAYLTFGDIHLMLEQANGPGRTFHSAPLEYPYGRGMNLQITVENVDDLYSKITVANLRPTIPLEERWYRWNDIELGNRQFVIADPDGYLLRFNSDLGERPLRR